MRCWNCDAIISIRSISCRKCKKKWWEKPTKEKDYSSCTCDDNCSTCDEEGCEHCDDCKLYCVGEY